MNRIYTVLYILLFLSAILSAGQAEWEAAIQSSAPLNWYKFDEASGTTCSDSGSQGLDGIYEDVALAQAGLFDSAAAVGFDASGANRILLNGSDLTGHWTAEYLVKRTGSGSQTLHDSGSYSIRLVQWNTAGLVGFTHYGNADYGFDAQNTQDLTTPEDEWAHLVFRKNSSGMQVFINGTQVGTSSNSIPLPRTAIGSHNGSNDKLNAVLDEAIVYDRALNDTEIADHFDIFAQAALPADFTGDFVVDLDDLLVLAQNWLSLCTPAEARDKGDADRSGRVEMGDQALLGKYWLKNYVPPPEPSVCDVIPKPQTAALLTGTFTIASDTSILYEQGNTELQQSAEYLAQMINTPAGYSLTAQSSTKTLPGTNEILLTSSGSDTTLGDEGYELQVEADSVLIRAPQGAGAFYGVQSLRWLLPDQIERDQPVTGTDWTVPCISIQDEPRFPWRGMHLDESRHFFGIDYVKKYIDYLAMYKMNTLHWHIDDDQGWRIEIPAYPLLTSLGAWRSGCDSVSPYGGFYTQAQVHEIVEYAQRRYIKIVPEIEMPGHTQAVLEAYPQYSCTGGPFADACANWSGVQYDNVFCPSEETFTFLESLLTEIMALFPSEYIHIGGDEVNKRAWQESAVAQQVMADNGLANENELQTWFISRINDFLVANGKKPIGWSEIINGGIPNNAVIMSWLGTGAGITAARNGHDAIMSPTSHCYFDYSYETTPTSEVYSFEPVPFELTEQEAQHVLGAQGNVWTEGMVTPADVDNKAIPRMTALAEVVWSPAKDRLWGDFEQRLEKHYLRLDELGVNYYYNWKIPGGPDLVESAVVSTTMGTYSDYITDYAYDGSYISHFWSSSAPSTGATFQITLDTPRQVDTIKVYMANSSKPDDWMQNGVVEVSADGTNFVEVATISTAEFEVSITAQTVKAVRLRCTAGQSNWVIIREIALE